MDFAYRQIQPFSIWRMFVHDVFFFFFFFIDFLFLIHPSNNLELSILGKSVEIFPYHVRFKTVKLTTMRNRPKWIMSAGGGLELLQIERCVNENTDLE